jgi:hypothetical protein
MATRPIVGARARLLAFIAACTLLSCSLGAGWYHPLPLAFLVPYPIQWTILRSDRVEIALTDDAEAVPYEVGPGGQVNWALRSPWKVLPPEQANAWRQIALNSRSYQIWKKKCMFSPNVSIRWIAGSDTATALLCHGCDVLIGWQGTSRMEGDVDPVRGELRDLTYAAFPDDSLLQLLAGRRRY